MASFFSKILSAFGSGQSSDAPQKTAQVEPHAHVEYLIFETPSKEGGQFRLAGCIEKTAGAELLAQEFVRVADLSSIDELYEEYRRGAEC